MLRWICLLFALMTAGLAACDGSGGPSEPRVRIVLERSDGGTFDGQGLATIREAVGRRAAGVADGVVEFEVSDDGTIVVEITDITPEGAEQKLAPTLLQFCAPVQNEAGDVATTRGKARYVPGTCEPERDANGLPVVDGGEIVFVAWSANSPDNPRENLLIWQPATAEIDGETIEMNGLLLRPSSFVLENQVTGQPIVQFEMTEVGADVAGAVTERLAERALPLAPFLDGEHLLDSRGQPIAPRVQGQITVLGSITGLSLDGAQRLSDLINLAGLRVVEISEATN